MRERERWSSLGGEDLGRAEVSERSILRDLSSQRELSQRELTSFFLLMVGFFRVKEATNSSPSPSPRSSLFSFVARVVIVSSYCSRSPISFSIYLGTSQLLPSRPVESAVNSLGSSVPLTFVLISLSLRLAILSLSSFPALAFVSSPS